MVDTVNMPYHHGNLREALVESAMALARTEGPDAVVLRAVARAAGVSHNAAYRHFVDRAALLRAVCERSMAQFALLIEARIGALPPDPDPVAAAWLALEATGRAYVEFATTEPGWFRTAFAVPQVHGYIAPGEGCGRSGLNPYELLGARLDALVEVGALPVGQRPGAEYPAWSSVHGLSMLYLDGPLRDLSAAELEGALTRVLANVAAGLAGPPGN